MRERQDRKAVFAGSSRSPFFDALKCIVPGTVSVCVSLDSVVINLYRVILGHFYSSPEPWGLYYISAILPKRTDTKPSAAIYKPQMKEHSERSPCERGWITRVTGKEFIEDKSVGVIRLVTSDSLQSHGL